MNCPPPPLPTAQELHAARRQNTAATPSPQGDGAGAVLSAGAAAAGLSMFEHSTLRLGKGDITLLRSLGDKAHDMACLVLYSGEDIGKRFALEATTAVIGRTAQAEIYIESPDISRRHAQLEQRAGEVLLSDLGSVNGTYRNDQRVEAPVALQDGDLIRLGKVVLKFFHRASLDALLHDRMYRMATIDAGTGVFCKRYLLQVLEREVGLAQRHGRPLSLVCLDLDHFKTVNDRYGHNAGDVVLRGTAAVVQQVVRGSDVFGRIGGEEFAVVLPNTTLSEAVEHAERYRAVVEQAVFELPPFDAQAGEAREADTLENRWATGSQAELAVVGERTARADASASGRILRHRQTASLGVAQFDREMHSARCLLGAADERLYAAKHGGRNRVISA